MCRKYWMLVGCWSAVSVLFTLTTGCHWEAKLGLGTITAENKLTIEEWAQANVLKAIDDLIAKVPDPNKADDVDNISIEPEDELVDE